MLAGQNLAAKAIDEYQALLTAEEVDLATKLSVVNLLVSLGREEEELAALNNIITNLRIQQVQQLQQDSPQE